MQFGQLKRREFFSLLGATAAWPLTARGQQPAEPVIGYLSVQAIAARPNYLAAFRKGLAAEGRRRRSRPSVQPVPSRSYSRVAATLCSLVWCRASISQVETSREATTCSRSWWQNGWR